MTTFNLRTTSPADTGYFKSTQNGGLNKALRINASTGAVLPNCVGYVYGAFSEQLGKQANLSTGNAKTLYGHTSDGYRRSFTPYLGAVACWGGGSYGHVAIVVGISSDHITVAQSNYGGARFEVVDCYKMSNGGYRSHGGNTNWQGCILMPTNYTYAGASKSSGSSTGSRKVTAKLVYSPRYQLKKWANGKTMKTKVNLNLRKGNSTSTAVKVCIPKGTYVHYYGKYDCQADNASVWWIWVGVTVNGKYYEGFVKGSSSYLEGYSD